MSNRVMASQAGIPEYLDFGCDTIQRSEDTPEQRLAEVAERWNSNRELYESHLIAAKWFEGWNERNQAVGGIISQEEEDGHARALRQVICHLRQGDFLPGGLLYEQTVPAQGSS